MENFVIKMDAIINNPNLPVLTKSVEFKLKKSTNAIYPLNVNSINNIISNCKLETKSGNAIFSVNGSDYTSSIQNTDGLKYINLTQDEEIIATILNESLDSSIYLANFDSKLALEIDIDTMMYFEKFGCPSGQGTKISGTALDLWNPNLTNLNVVYTSAFQEAIDLSDYLLFNNGKLNSYYVSSNIVTFDLKKLDENPLFNGKTLNALCSYGTTQMIYTGEATDTITWKCNMIYFAFKHSSDARKWFLALANSPNAIANLKDVRLITPGTFPWNDTDCIAAKNTIINTLTQAFINTCPHFEVFGQNWKQ